MKEEDKSTIKIHWLDCKSASPHYTIRIGKLGNVYLKEDIQRILDVSFGDRLLVGYISDNNGKDIPIELIIIKTNKENFNGFKINMQLSINIKSILDKLNIKYPNVYNYEKFIDKNYKGIKIFLKDEK